MKQTIVVAGIAMLAAGQACAQSSVTVYGLIDLAASYYRGEGHGRSLRLTSGAGQQTRLGFRGREDLGDGLFAAFEMEAGINADTGAGQATNANNQASGASAAGGGMTFNRKSFVALGGRWGEVRLGRDYVPSFWVLFAYDPFRRGVGFGAGATQGASPYTQLRASNSISYLTGRCFTYECTGFHAHVAYAFGENASGPNRKDGSVAGVRVGYGGGRWDVAVGHTETRDLAVGNYQQTLLGASWDWGGGRLLLQTGRHRTGRPAALLAGGTQATFAQVGAFINAGPGTIPIAVTHIKRNDALGGGADKLAVGYIHALSKRTALYGTLAFIDNQGSMQLPVNVGGDAGPLPVRGGRSSGVDLGIRHSF